MTNPLDLLFSLLPRRKPNRSCGTMILWSLPPEKAQEVVAWLDALPHQSPPSVPQLSLATLVKLSTHEQRVVQESPQVEREPDPDDAQPRRRICLNLIMSLPMEQRQRVMARLLAEAEQWDDAPSMRLVEKSGPKIVEPE